MIIKFIVNVCDCRGEKTELKSDNNYWSSVKFEIPELFDFLPIFHILRNVN